MARQEVVAALPDLAAGIVAAHGRVVDAMREGCEHAVRAGGLLLQAKEQVPHGQWKTWIQDNCPVSLRTAQVYMRLAKNRPALESKSATLTLLPTRQAVQLLAAPRRPADWRSHLGAIGPDTDDADLLDAVRLLVKLHDAPPGDLLDMSAMTLQEASAALTEAGEYLDSKTDYLLKLCAARPFFKVFLAGDGPAASAYRDCIGYRITVLNILMELPATSETEWPQIFDADDPLVILTGGPASSVADLHGRLVDLHAEVSP